MAERPLKPKKPFLSGYRTYDDSQGRGDPDEWRENFGQRMGYDEAVREIGDDSPHGILGLKTGCPWEDVKKAYRKLARENHPDVNKAPDAEAKMKKINGAYMVLEKHYGIR